MKTLVTILFFCLALQLNAQSELIENKDSTNVHLREVPRHNLLIETGVYQTSGDFKSISKSGLNIALGYDYYINKHIALSSNLRFQNNPFSVTAKPNQNLQISSEDFKTVSIAMGGTYSYTKNRFQLDTSLKGGIAFLNAPANVARDLNSNPSNDIILVTNSNYSKKSTGYYEVEIRFNYYFRRNVQLYVAPQYTSTIAKPIAFIRNNDLKETSNLSNYGINVGIKFALGKTYSNGERKD